MSKVKINKEHVTNLIEFLYKEVCSSGGDGDALWYSKHYSIEDLLECFKEYNDDNAIGWKFADLSVNTFHWGNSQEWVTVTTSKELYDSSPDWQQIKIQY